jgi:iron complex outermembrane receptor protein
MMKNYLILFILFTGLLNLAFAQEVSGKILDGETSNPLPGASVLIKGTASGVLSDFDGNYTI